MSPRPAPSRSDPTAVRCLSAAAQLIDQAVDPNGATAPRLRGIRFPPSLDWIRISDVVRMAQQSENTWVSRRALLNRWPSREEFLRDAIVFAMCYRDVPDADQVDPSTLGANPSQTNLADMLATVADDVYAALMRHPRSFLLSQIAPFLAQHAIARQAVAAAGNETRQSWLEAYRRLIDALGLHTRPDWPLDRISVALQCILDGVVVRHQIQSDLINHSAWASASLLSDTIIAFCMGVLDFQHDGQTSRDHLNQIWSIGSQVDLA